MRKLIISVVVVVVIAVGGFSALVLNDLGRLREDVDDINFSLGDVENVLRGTPSGSDLDLLRRRLTIIRDDLGLLGLHHQWALMFFPDETESVFDRYAKDDNTVTALEQR